MFSPSSGVNIAHFFMLAGPNVYIVKIIKVSKPLHYLVGSVSHDGRELHLAKAGRQKQLTLWAFLIPGATRTQTGTWDYINENLTVFLMINSLYVVSRCYSNISVRRDEINRNIFLGIN